MCVFMHARKYTKDIRHTCLGRKNIKDIQPPQNKYAATLETFPAAPRSCFVLHGALDLRIFYGATRPPPLCLWTLAP